MSMSEEILPHTLALMVPSSFSRRQFHGRVINDYPKVNMNWLASVRASYLVPTIPFTPPTWAFFIDADSRLGAKHG